MRFHEAAATFSLILFEQSQEEVSQMLAVQTVAVWLHVFVGVHCRLMRPSVEAAQEAPCWTQVAA